MYLLVGFILFAVTLVKSEKQNCNLTVIRGVNFEQEVLKDNLKNPFQLNVAQNTNTLYFTFTSDLDSDSNVSTASINLTTGEFSLFDTVSLGISTAVNNKDHVIYFSGTEGIQSYNSLTKELKYVTANGTFAWQMFYSKGRLFYIDPTFKAFVFDGVDTKRVNDTLGIPEIDTICIAVDKYDNIWLGNLSGLFYVKDLGKINSVGNYVVTWFTTDTNGNLYFAGNEGVYSIAEDLKIELILEKDNVLSMAFDANNHLVFSTIYDQIIRLKPTDKTCPPK